MGIFSSNSNDNSDSDTSAIDQKDAEKNSSTETTKDDWLAFAMTIPTNIIYTFMFVLVGTSIIFYGTLDNLDLFFNTDLDSYFDEPPAKCGKDEYEGGRRRTGGGRRNVRKQRGGGYSCNNQAPSQVEPSCAAAKLGIPPSIESWPYSMRDGDETGFSIQGLKNWLAISQAKTWVALRNIMKSFLEFFSGEANSSFITKDSFRLTVPFLLMLISSVILLPGLAILGGAINIYNMGETSLLWSCLGFFCGLWWLSWLGTAIITPLNFIATITILPLYLDTSTIKSIFICNVQLVGLIFGALMASSSFQYLDSTTAGCMTGTWLILLIMWIMGK